MSPALERGAEEGHQAGAGKFDANKSTAERDDIGVVVLTGEPRARFFVDERAADMGVPIGRNRNADTATADQHTEARATLPKGSRQTISKDGIVNRLWPIGSKIKDRVPGLGEGALKVRFQVDAAMVGGKCDR